MLHLTFDDTVNDTSGYGNNGTIINPLNVIYDNGAVGRAIKFGGVNKKGSVQIPQNSSLALHQEMTVSYWVRMDNHYGEYNNDNNFIAKGNHAVFVKGQEGSLSSYIYTGSNAADLWYQRVPSNKGIKVNNPFAIEEWVHVAFTISSTQEKGYVNGVEVISNNLSSPVNLSTSNNGVMYIGWLNSSWYALDGAVDDFRMYNTALSASEINGLYQLKNN
ncbi:LamG domain-containing protein [Metabacillus fastidiosus]|uniref:LamG domain-containing protein n=1 Tax=Metabacillus fastidiosus TaxID=1458 RepID=UPI002E1D9DDD|nr:LamG domain-containing protein [Metabacillus fastidiosus]